MQAENLYRRLLLLPFFQGLPEHDYYEIAERIKLNFKTYAQGTTIVRQGNECDAYCFVLRGALKVVRESHAGDYKLTEWTDMPTLLCPESLYGLDTKHTRSFSAASNVSVLEIPKTDVFNVLMEYTTFRLNYMNYFSWRQQEATRVAWQNIPRTPQKRFVQFVKNRCLRPIGRKQLQITQQVLAREMAVALQVLQTMLEEYSNKRLIETSRGIIDIPNLEKL